MKANNCLGYSPIAGIDPKKRAPKEELEPITYLLQP